MADKKDDDQEQITKRLEPVPSNGAQIVTGRQIDLSVAISLKRIADSLHTLTSILRPRR
jgi:hypothetical protein